MPKNFFGGGGLSDGPRCAVEHFLKGGERSLGGVGKRFWKVPNTLGRVRTPPSARPRKSVHAPQPNRDLTTPAIQAQITRN